MRILLLSFCISVFSQSTLASEISFFCKSKSSKMKVHISDENKITLTENSFETSIDSSTAFSFYEKSESLNGAIGILFFKSDSSDKPKKHDNYLEIVTNQSGKISDIQITVLFINDTPEFYTFKAFECDQAELLELEGRIKKFDSSLEK